MIRINPNLYDLTRLHKSKNFEGFSEVVAIDRTFVSLKLVNYDVEFNWQAEKWENLKCRYCTIH
jgi:hypothetical protein